MGSKQHHFVLVHGAGHGAWCWARIVPALEKSGHRVTTVDLMGAGENPLNAEDCTSFEQYNLPLEDLFKSFPDGEKVILAGHSMGGLSLTYMSAQFPKNISVAVYLAAMMPPPGLELFDVMVKTPGFLPQLNGNYFTETEGGPPKLRKIAEADMKQFFYNECTPEDLATGLKHIRSFPDMDVLLAPINGPKENYATVPRVCVIALEDKVLSIDKAPKLMIEMNPPNEVIEINADHSLFFSGDDTVVKILKDAATKYDA